MRFLLWEIKTDDDRLAKIQWILYKLFGIKPKQPCGYTKSQYGFYCRQPFDLEHCYVINSGDRGTGYTVQQAASTLERTVK